MLIVDDDPIIIKALEDALSGDGHATVAASGGQAALDTFTAANGTDSAFALVISDLGMPNVDGRRVAAGVKRLSPATPVIMLTGWGTRMIDENDIPGARRSRALETAAVARAAQRDLRARPVIRRGQSTVCWRRYWARFIAM